MDYVTNCDLLTDKSNILDFDPIDGTICFSNNIPIRCIQVDFVIDEKCKFAIIYCPTINEIYIADENGLKTNGKSIKNNLTKPINQSIVNCGDLVQKNEKVFSKQLEIIKTLGLNCQKVKIFGSAGYEFCMVASGRIQAYMLFGNNV